MNSLSRVPTDYSRMAEVSRSDHNPPHEWLEPFCGKRYTERLFFAFGARL